MSAKKDELTGIVNPANLWGKPLPQSLSKPTRDVREKKMVHDEEDDEPVVDVRSELEAIDEPTDDELIDEENGVEDEDFAPEEGDKDAILVAEDDAELEEDEESESEEVGAAVASEEDEEVAVKAPRKKRETAMAETKKKSISDYVRDEIERRQESGDSLRGVDIVNALAARKVTVSPAQVSQLLKKAGVSSKARGPRKTKVAAAVPAEGRSRAAGKATAKKAEKATPAAPRQRAAAENGLKLPMAQLQAAEAFVTTCGGFKQAERILTLAAQIAE